MSLVKTSGRDNNAVEFRQEVRKSVDSTESTGEFKCGSLCSLCAAKTYKPVVDMKGVESSDCSAFFFQSSLVKFNDPRPESESNNQLFFAAFEWRDPYIQEIKLVGSLSQRRLYSFSFYVLTRCPCA